MATTISAPAALPLSLVSSSSSSAAWSTKKLPRGRANSAIPAPRPQQRKILRVRAENASECVTTDRSTQVPAIGKRCLLLGPAAAAVLAAVSATIANPAVALPPTIPGVGSFLPAAGLGDLVVYRPADNATPAMRAGIVKPYSFFLPPTWKQMKVANIASGNYCQPKCAEPWTEVKFEDVSQGTLVVLVAPLVRLTNKPAAKIEDLGTPTKLIDNLGQFITGDSFEEEGLASAESLEIDGQTYYKYELNTPGALTGSHSYASISAIGEVVMILAVTAGEKQWSKNRETLKQLADSFRVALA